MTKHTSEKTKIDIPADVLVKARGRARSLGMTLSEYMKSLVDKDVATKEHDPWREPVPKEVDEEWERDLAETEEYEKTHPRPSAKSGAELVRLLDAEAATLPDDEGD